MARIRDTLKYRGARMIEYGGMYYYWLTLEDTGGKHLGYYSATDILKLDECKIEMHVLQNRLRYLRGGTGSFKSTWDCITRDVDETKNCRKNHNAPKTFVYQESVDTWNLMKQWPVTKSVNNTHIYF